MARRGLYVLASDTSLDSSELSQEGALASSSEEDGIDFLPHGIKYKKVVRNFEDVKHDERFDIKPSWSGLKLRTITKDETDNAILADRVVDLLNRAMIHLKIMRTLSTLLDNDGALLRKWLPKLEAEYVIRCFQEQNLTAENKRQVRNAVGLPVDRSLQRAYRILTMSKCLNKYVLKYPPKLSRFLQIFFGVASEFGVYAHKYIKLTAKELADKDDRLRLIYERMPAHQIELRRLRRTVSDNIAENQGALNKRIEQIEKKQAQLDETINYFNGLMRDCLTNSDKILYFSGEASMLKQEELSEAAKEAQITSVTTLEADIAEERLLRTRKIKYEAQQAIWLTKYDTDVGEKQHILDEMTEGYEKENAEVQELECLMMEQQMVLFRCLDEQEEEELAEYGDALHEVAAKRATRIITKYWREYAKRKLARKIQKAKAKKRKIAGKKK